MCVRERERERERECETQKFGEYCYRVSASRCGPAEREPLRLRPRKEREREREEEEGVGGSGFLGMTWTDLKMLSCSCYVDISNEMGLRGRLSAHTICWNIPR